MKTGKMYFNLIHRAGGYEENFKMLQLQQDMAHEYGLKATVVMSYEAMQIQNIVDKVKEYHEKYEDEIGLLLNTIEDGNSMLNGNYTFWLYSMDEKVRIINASIQKFKDVFGFYPTALTTYYLDAPTIQYIKSNYPFVETVIATCFEEGSRTFRGTNYDCHLFSEGGPWWPWIPSKKNSQCPAFDEEDDLGVVALPHLTRDMLASIEDRNDYFASHPQNITRGWIFNDYNWSYLYNFLDMTAVQFRYNNGYSYSNMYVDPKWLMDMGRYDDYLKVDIYRDAIRYIAELKAKGYVVDMRMTEFASWYRENRGYHQPDISLWKDVVFGSEKQIFWYIDSYMRATVDPVQGGAITDLRPYVGRVERPVGPDTEFLYDGSYPYILHSQYRGGYPAFMSTKSMYTCALSYNGETKHLRTHRTECEFEKKEEGYSVIMAPVEVEFTDMKVFISSEVLFIGEGKIQIKRRIMECTIPDADIEIFEFLNGCWGTTEYPQDLRRVKLFCVGKNESKSKDYQYSGTFMEVEDVQCVYARIPDVKTGIKLTSNLRQAKGAIFDGPMAGQMYTIGIKGKLKMGEVSTTCLLIEGM